MNPAARHLWRHFSSNRMALAALVFIIFVTLASSSIAIMSHYRMYWPMNPNTTSLDAKLLPPSKEHWMGTDHLGRDVFSRVIAGATISLIVGLTAMSVSLLLGVLVGATAGYCGGTIDNVLMRTVDVLLCFPTFFLILTAVALLGPNLMNVVIVIGLISWTGTARLIRAEFLSLRETEYVRAAKVLGQHGWKIIIRHILPNTAALIIITAIVGIPEAILAEAGLSFLGFGVQPPQATWGNIIADGKIYLLDAWWLIFFPGLAILIISLAFYIVGDRLRQANQRQHPSY